MENADGWIKTDDDINKMNKYNSSNHSITVNEKYQ